MKTDVSPQGMSQTGKFQGTRQELKEKLITCWTVTCKECEIDGCTCFDIRKAIDQLEAIVARDGSTTGSDRAILYVVIAINMLLGIVGVAVSIIK